MLTRHMKEITMDYFSLLMITKRYVSWSGVKRQEFDGSFVTEKR